MVHLSWRKWCGTKAGRRVKKAMNCVAAKDYNNREASDGRCHLRRRQKWRVLELAGRQRSVDCVQRKRAITEGPVVTDVITGDRGSTNPA